MSEQTAIEWCDSNVRPGRSGPKPATPRDGDKKQARQRINVEVRTGRRAHPNTLACFDCGHVWSEGERRHEYDHYLGYAACHHASVQPVCTVCHARRDSARAAQTHCHVGHEFTEENTYLASNGTRHCKACMSLREKKRKPRGSAYWKRVNAKRRDQRLGKAASDRLLDGVTHDGFPEVRP